MTRDTGAIATIFRNSHFTGSERNLPALTSILISFSFSYGPVTASPTDGGEAEQGAELKL